MADQAALGASPGHPRRREWDGFQALVNTFPVKMGQVFPQGVSQHWFLYRLLQEMELRLLVVAAKEGPEGRGK